MFSPTCHELSAQILKKNTAFWLATLRTFFFPATYYEMYLPFEREEPAYSRYISSHEYQPQCGVSSVTLGRYEQKISLSLPQKKKSVSPNFF